MSYKLVLLRHGESEWNAKNLFTGWVDVPLSDKGRAEATHGGELLKESGVLPDLLFTSMLRRAIMTANLALDAADRHWIPVERNWRLNERHYGALQGKNKKEIRDEFGEEQFMLWRRSFDVAPPAIEAGSEFSQDQDPRYAGEPVPMSDTKLTITVDTDGSGTYTSPTTTFTLNGHGGGTYTNSATGETITNNGDGSGTHTTRTVTIINNGDGTGNYTDPNLTIINNGDGTAMVNGTTITGAPKVEKASTLGTFPPVESLKPVESCGTLITLEDGVLFDFGKSDIRPDAAQTLTKLADILTNAKVPAAHIYGHTDSVSDEAFNQQLSEARANAVKNDLSTKGVTATMDATGYGESKPVAPNENADGSDNPAGRALNRRVEIFIPAF